MIVSFSHCAVLTSHVTVLLSHCAVPKRIPTLQIWNLSLKKKKYMMGSIPLLLSTKKKKKIYNFYTLFFVNIFFLNLKNRNGLPKFFFFIVFWIFFFKWESNTYNIKIIIWKQKQKIETKSFNFLKIIFILFWKLLFSILLSSHFSIPSQFSILLLFHPSYQMDPKGLIYLFFLIFFIHVILYSKSLVSILGHPQRDLILVVIIY